MDACPVCVLFPDGFGLPDEHEEERWFQTRATQDPRMEAEWTQDTDCVCLAEVTHWEVRNVLTALRVRRSKGVGPSLELAHTRKRLRKRELPDLGVPGLPWVACNPWLVNGTVEGTKKGAWSAFYLLG